MMRLPLSQLMKACATTLVWTMPHWAAVAILALLTIPALPMCMRLPRNSTSTRRLLLLPQLRRAPQRLKSRLLACLQSQLPKPPSSNPPLAPHQSRRSIKLQKGRHPSPRVTRRRLPTQSKPRLLNRSSLHMKQPCGQSLRRPAILTELRQFPLRLHRLTPCLATLRLLALLVESPLLRL